MIKLFTDEEFDNAKTKQLLPLMCKSCKKTFFLTKHRIQDSILERCRTTGDYCCRRCFFDFTKPPLLLPCDNCGKIFRKKPKDMKKTKNNFCGHSCSATYQNTHKTTGTRCSKLEKWLSVKLVEKFPLIEFHFNRKDAIVSELDIYIPSLKLAFELNGLFHYEPIYGSDKLKSIQNNDNRKFQACLEKGIELCIIDVSKHTYFKESTCLPFLKIIEDIILLKLSRVGNNPIPETT